MSAVPEWVFEGDITACTLLASAGLDRTVRLWDTAPGESIDKSLTGHRGVVLAVAFNREGTLLTSAGNEGMVRLWNTDTGDPVIEPLTDPGGLVRSLALNPAGTRLASAGNDGTVRLWNLDGVLVNALPAAHTGAPLQATLNWRMGHIALAIPDARGIRVAFLSTRVLRDVTDVHIFPAGLLHVQVGDDPPGPDGPATMNQMGCGALEVTIRAGGPRRHDRQLPPQVETAQLPRRSTLTTR